MEAVGLTASIITLINAVTLTSSALTRLWGLRGCPLYVVLALNEVNDFNATLTLVQSALDVGEVPDDVIIELERLIYRARQQLEGFDRYLKDHVLRKESGTFDIQAPKLKRRAKFMEIVGEAQHQIDGLQQGLLSIKVNLTLALGVGQL
jgi:hypothetical protein